MGRSPRLVWCLERPAALPSLRRHDPPQAPMAGTEGRLLISRSSPELPTEFDATTFISYYRSPAECTGPLQDTGSAVYAAGLRLVRDAVSDRGWQGRETEEQIPATQPAARSSGLSHCQTASMMWAEVARRTRRRRLTPRCVTCAPPPGVLRHRCDAVPLPRRLDCGNRRRGRRQARSCDGAHHAHVEQQHLRIRAFVGAPVYQLLP